MTSRHLTEQKIEDFFLALVSLTKSGRISWERLPNIITFSKDDDVERSFFATYKQSEFFIVRDIESDDIRFYITPCAGTRTQIGEDNDPSLVRLYNLVYSRYPGIEKIVDDVIADAISKTGIVNKTD